jgi:predicted MFS family arabinose efflux permease
MVAASYGLARYGYGLLLPDIRASFDLSTRSLGLIGTGSYVAYLAATVAAVPLATRRGPRFPVVLGGGAATGGMLLAGLSSNALLLACGVLVAGASSGLVFPPFSDLVGALVRPDVRGRALAAVSSGTGYGVAVAVPVALLVGREWRTAWLFFAALSALATLWAARTLPGGRVADTPPRESRLGLRRLAAGRSRSLLAGSFVIGLGASVYWTFAVDYVVRDGSLSAAAARLLLAAVGVATVGGTLAGELVRRADPRRSFFAVSSALASSFWLLSLEPSALVAVLLSAALFGVTYSVVVAIEVIWSAQVFADRPSAGLGAVMFAMGLGLLLGPAGAGALAGQIGLANVFLLGGGVVAAAVLFAPRGALERG